MSWGDAAVRRPEGTVGSSCHPQSTSEVYGSHPHDPVMHTEDSSSRRPPADGFGRDSMDIEAYARGLARRRPDIAVTILRLANMIGPRWTPRCRAIWPGRWSRSFSAVTRGLQLLHEQDALGALERATMAGRRERSTSVPAASS